MITRGIDEVSLLTIKQKQGKNTNPQGQQQHIEQDNPANQALEQGKALRSWKFSAEGHGEPVGGDGAGKGNAVGGRLSAGWFFACAEPALFLAAVG